MGSRKAPLSRSPALDEVRDSRRAGALDKYVTHVTLRLVQGHGIMMNMSIHDLASKGYEVNKGKADDIYTGCIVRAHEMFSLYTKNVQPFTDHNLHHVSGMEVDLRHINGSEGDFDTVSILVTLDNGTRAHITLFGDDVHAVFTKAVTAALATGVTYDPTPLDV